MDYLPLLQILLRWPDYVMLCNITDCLPLFQILLRLTRLCIQETAEPGVRKPKKHEQRLLRNMSAPNVVLELLQISYEFVRVNTASDQSCVIH